MNENVNKCWIFTSKVISFLRFPGEQSRFSLKFCFLQNFGILEIFELCFLKASSLMQEKKLQKKYEAV